MNIFLIYFAIPLAASLQAEAQAETQAESPILSVGEVRTIQVSTSREIRVSSGKVIRVMGLPPKLKVVGRAAGEAVISYGQTALRVNVLEPHDYVFFNRASQFKWLRGLRIEVSRGQVKVRGTLLRFGDWQRLVDLQHETGAHYQFLADVDPLIQSMVQSHLEAWCSKRLPGIHKVQVQPVIRILTNIGAANTKDRRPDSMNAPALEEWGLKAEEVPDLAVSKQNLHLKLTFLEVVRGGGHSLGLDWNDGQSLILGAKIQAPEEFRQKIRFLSEKGVLRVLAEPTLTLSLEKETEFVAGGEFAVRTRDHRSTSVQWKKHGLILKIKPLSIFDGDVRLSFDAELSLPDYSQTVDGVPSLRTTRNSTEVSLALGASMPLSALERTFQSQSQLGVRGLEDLPILGNLFKSRSFQENESSFSLFATLLSDDSADDPAKDPVNGSANDPVGGPASGRNLQNLQKLQKLKSKIQDQWQRSTDE